MSREYCQMCHYNGDDRYCEYYDVLFMKCIDVKHCPDGLDDDEDYYEEE